MAVFYDTGGGDIYGGPDKKSILAAMIRDGGDEHDYETKMYEVSPQEPMATEDGTIQTIADEYGSRTDAVCVASDNC